MPPTTSSIQLGVVLLAAGASTRMGRPKLLLPWGDTSVLGHLVAQWRRLGAEQIVVVCRRDDEALHRALDQLEIPVTNRVINPSPECGMFSSIVSAARWTGWKAELSHWAVAIGDQPLVALQTLQGLLEFVCDRPNQICQPSRGGRGRHPVFFPAAEFGQLATATEQHLKEFLENRRTIRTFCESDDPGLDLDLDEPADYEMALRLTPTTPVTA